MLAFQQAAGERAVPRSAPGPSSSATLRSLAPEGFPDLFVWADTCNVYVLRQGESAILIGLGDGSVLAHLGEAGVKRVEWVLFTDHHREQCQGYPRLAGWNVKIDAPRSGASALRAPVFVPKMHPKLGDPLTVHSSSYVRPPIWPVPLDRGFARIGTPSTGAGVNFGASKPKATAPGACLTC